MPIRSEENVSKVFSSRLKPVPSHQEISIQTMFIGIGFDWIFVVPGDHGWHRRHHRLSAFAGLKTIFGSSVVHQIELNVAATAIQLKGALSVAVRHCLTSVENGPVAREKMVPNTPDELEAAVKTASAPIIEK